MSWGYLIEPKSFIEHVLTFRYYSSLPPFHGIHILEITYVTVSWYEVIIQSNLSTNLIHWAHLGMAIWTCHVLSSVVSRCRLFSYSIWIHKHLPRHRWIRKPASSRIDEVTCGAESCEPCVLHTFNIHRWMLLLRAPFTLSARSEISELQKRKHTLYHTAIICLCGQESDLKYILLDGLRYTHDHSVLISMIQWTPAYPLDSL